MAAYSDRDRSEAPTGAPLHEATDRDGGDVAGGWIEETPENLRMLAEEEASLAAAESAYEERVREHAEAIHQATCPARPQCGGSPRSREIEAARACVAVEDRHTAALLAEVTRLRGEVEHWQQKWKKRGLVIDRLRGEVTEAQKESALHFSLLDGETALALIDRDRTLRGPEPTEEPS